jgi:hypothetical protein
MSSCYAIHIVIKMRPVTLSSVSHIWALLRTLELESGVVSVQFSQTNKSYAFLCVSAVSGYCDLQMFCSDMCNRNITMAGEVSSKCVSLGWLFHDTIYDSGYDDKCA